jgi:hypothetical protein
MTPQLRGTIIKTPDSSPGLLFVEGQQKTFTLERVWKSPVAPALNMAVDVELDGAGLITSLTAVDPQQAAREKLEQIGGAAQKRGKEAAVIAQHGIGALAARMGKIALAAIVVLWIAWFFMPFLTVGQIVGSRAITFWDFLALDLSNEIAPLQLVLSSHGLLSIIGLAAIAAPFAAPFVRRPSAKFLYAMPLAYLILVAVAVLWNFNHAVGEAADIAKRSITYVPQNPRWNEMQARSMQGVADRLEQSLLNSISIGYGAFAIVLASLFLAVCVFRRRASDNARNAIKPPTGGVSFIANGFCTTCGEPRSVGAQYCTVCGAQHASAAGA